MTFDNSLKENPSIATQIRQHVPIAILLIGILALPIGLHTTSQIVLIVAIGHLVLGGLILAAKKLIENRRTT